MLMWLIIAVVFLVVAFYYFQMEHHTKKIKVVVFIIVLGLIYFSVAGVMSSGKVDLSSPRGVVNAVYFYFGWVGSTAVKLWDVGVETVHMVGNAIKDTDEEDERDQRR